ncbi:MAG: hypothetical protein IPL99_08915 [Candidatus Competibacteraceae bacterium]|nr:hypothetical protein [Candidatus Competibacteraceae bacterium]
MKSYMATFRPAFNTSGIVFPIQFIVTTETRQDAQKKARMRVNEQIQAGKLESWRVGSLRLKELAD